MVTTLGLQRSLKPGAAMEKIPADCKCVFDFTNGYYITTVYSSIVLILRQILRKPIRIV